MNRTTRGLLRAGGVVLVWVAVAIADVGDAPPANAVCPVLTDQQIDPHIFADYQGERVWFCCPRCRKAFLENPQAYVGNLPQFSGSTGDSGVVAGGGARQHDHETGHGEPQGSSRMIRFAGKFHPLFVHFPIALIISAGLAEALRWFTRRAFFDHAARFTLILGGLFGIATAGLGWAAGAFVQYPDKVGEILTIHRWLGTSAGSLVVVAAIFSEAYRRGHRRRLAAAYRISLFAAVVVVAVAGHFGGMLVFGPEHYTW